MHSTRAAIARVLLITVYGLGIALCLPIPGPIGRTTFATVSAIPFGTVTTVSETAVQAAFVAAVLISIFGAGAWVIVGRTVLPRLFARAAAAPLESFQGAAPAAISFISATTAGLSGSTMPEPPRRAAVRVGGPSPPVSSAPRRARGRASGRR